MVKSSKESTAGWRQIGQQKKYFRSLWEANYAFYLQWLQDRRDIILWEHEPETFWFENIKRGVRSYLPDFRILNNDGSTHYVEVKGYWDAKSITKVRRFNKYYPDHKLILIDSAWFRKNGKKMKLIIPGWETCASPKILLKKISISTSILRKAT